jgi:GH43 family beta-xylosidase
MKLKVINRLYVVLLLIFVIGCKKKDKPPVEEFVPPIETTFTNPLLNGADPWVYLKDGTYYYLHTMGNSIRLWKTDALSKIASAQAVTVFTPTSGQPNSRNIWAPEIFFLDNKWYIYYTAGNGEDRSQRTWVLENSNADPTTGTWVDKGRIFSTDRDFWAIDGTVLEYNNSRYFLWAGRPDVNNVDLTQKIYIAKMSNPWTLEGSSTLLTSPQFQWERNGFGVNEAPQVLTINNKVFMTYSASFCGTDDYALGMLSLNQNGNPLNINDWVKRDQPVFTKKPQSGAYGPGHNSFFKSPDGKENWIIYHANSSPNQGCSDQRNIRIQKFSVGADGAPIFGEPAAIGLQIVKPSGEK